MAIGRIPEPGTGIPESIIAAKGDLIVGTANDAPGILSVGTNGHTLVADSSVSPQGLKWAVDPVADVVTTAGDLLYGTAADTVTRLGIGTAGQVLQVNSGATAPEWATPAGGGGMTLLSTTTLSSTSTTISSISGSYKHLLIYAKSLTVSVDADGLSMRFNSDTGNNYNTINIRQINNSVSATNDLSISSITLADRLQSSGTVNKLGSAEIWLYRYTDTDHIDIFSRAYGNNGTQVYCDTRTSRYDGTAAITSITFLSAVTMGGTIYLYGVN
jgi:hypothetical protein